MGDYEDMPLDELGARAEAGDREAAEALRKAMLMVADAIDQQAEGKDTTQE